MTIDKITLSVIQAGLQQVCDEMDLSFSRAAFSPVISEANDRSDGIYAADNGDLIAQGIGGLPVFVGTMEYSTRELIRLIKEGKVLAPIEKDIYIVNDPYLGGTHLMDVRFVRPYFRNGKIFCWLSNTGHWPDIGGSVPGGFSASATSVVQEGLRLPPVKLFKAGKLDNEIYSIICSNIRVADQRIGDVKAQEAALLVGEERLNVLLDKYGDNTVQQAIAHLRSTACSQMKSFIKEIPDGVYKSSAWVDSDGVVNEPLEIKLSITKKDEELKFDFSGSSLPCKGPMNSVLATTLSSVYLAMRHIFPEVPINGGAFIPLKVIRPINTFLDAHYPRPVSGCAAEVSQRIAEAVFIALVNVLPTRVTAAPAGTSGNFALGGFDEKTKSDFVMYQLSGGGYGGNLDHDGLTNGCSTIGISKAPPVEIMEQKFPVLYHHYAIHEGSGGGGTQRGGFGLDYKLEILCENAEASFVMDHGRFGPQGVKGGLDGNVNIVQVTKDKSIYIPLHLSKEQGIQLRKGDTVHVKTPGGGGYGKSFDRNEDLVLKDVKEQKYTIDDAIKIFGVFIDKETFKIDKLKTKSLRINKN
jgi:N-methylhydantoinase B|tara:strand:- start:309 stop:2054 length:1746 start_codon:yes stop_codon:yes gene_type:complete